MNGPRELRVRAEVDKLDTVLSFIDEELESAGCPLKVQMQIDVAAEEIFVNIAHYAYGPEGGDAIIGLSVNGESSEAVISFTDSGIEFDPLAKQDPDVTLAAEERQIGGLGIYMVKKSMDQVTYKRDAGRNILMIRKTW
ncbi:MAG: ATP-binding protein [Lachnospiraceae bacterium]|nr:ATP-binding protein [Lachnospiraceae bacterium]